MVAIPFCMWVQEDAKMRGMRVEPAQLFCKFWLDDHVLSAD